MLFNSLDFAVFFPIVFFLFWFWANKRLARQNAFIVLTSYIFYGWWDWRFLFLIMVSTLTDYWVGQGLSHFRENRARKALLWTSIIVNLGLLGFFKYHNFFVESFISAFSFLGSFDNPYSLNIILPVGISFYTFQTMSYTIDVYRNKMAPTDDFLAFSAFVCFFPQLVAGPIERGRNLLPQFFSKRQFKYENAVDGLRQILWGFFKKIVIADNCAQYANYIFGNWETLSGGTLILGAVFFAFQIYGDFSGYSDIAIGTARLLGFNLKQNFAFPYFSRDIAEFWRRWHISLSTWFRDYLYIPLGGSQVSLPRKTRNIFVIFTVSGLWHGANWTFVAWGILNALYFLPLVKTRHRRYLNGVAQDRLLPSPVEIVQMLSTFAMVTMGWIFFRSGSMENALGYIYRIFSRELFRSPLTDNVMYEKSSIALILVFIAMEWAGRRNLYAIEKLDILPFKPLRWAFYYLMILIIYFFGSFSANIEFIYFQF